MSHRCAPPRTLPALLLLAATLIPTHASRDKLALRHLTVDLPGPPSKVIPADLDRDGRTDLVVVVAYTEIEEIGESRIEGMVEITTVIPAVFDRREVHVYLARDGGYAAALTLELPPSVLHLEAGSGELGVVGLTDEGLSRLVLGRDGDGPALSMEPMIADPPVLARTRSFYARLRLVYDLDGDGSADVLLPSKRGLRVYLTRQSGTRLERTHELPWPEHDDPRGTRRRYPLPQVRDLNGDGFADLLFHDGYEQGWSPEVFLGSGAGTFRPLRAEARDCHDRLSDVRMRVAGDGAYPWPRDLDDLRDLDGDGRAEAVFSHERDRGDGMRKELKDAKRPIQDFRFHRLNDRLLIEPEPYFSMQVIGHSGGPEEQQADSPIRLDQFADLDGDGREDLITITLDFSIFQAVKILTTKRMGIGVDFHVYAQQPDGSFVKVPDLDLSEKLKLDLDNLKVGRFAQFAGDFDGDGRQDFVHLGRGRRVTIHRGAEGCRYPGAPDLEIELAEEPASIDLMGLEDLDGDGLSDLRVTRPLSDDDPDVSAPVRLDLYLSGGTR